MAAGDIILENGGTVTASDIQKIAAAVKSQLASESKDLSQYENVEMLSGVSSLPGFMESGATKKLVRVALSVLKGTDGKTPVISGVDVNSGGSSSGSINFEGNDSSGNPKYKVNLTLQKGDKGESPKIEIGEVTTLEPTENATASVTYKGDTEEGKPIYELNLGIPKGSTGDGGGNVYVNTSGLDPNKFYAFKPSSNGSANGQFVEIVLPGTVLLV